MATYKCFTVVYQMSIDGKWENEYYKVDNFYRAAGFAQGILERGDTFRLLSIEAMPVGVGLEYFE